MGLRPGTLGALIAGVALLVAGVLWANALSAPVQRAGRPTASVTPLPAPTPTTASPTPSGEGPEPTDAPEEPGAPEWPRVRSSGKFEAAGVEVAAAGSAGKLRRVAVRVETSARLDADDVARGIADVLNDPRSWAGSGNVRFAIVGDADEADLLVTIASRRTAAKTCTPEPSTCADGGDVVVDAARWRGRGAGYADRGSWQAYLVNHAFGQALGEGRQDCQKRGRPMPVMAPQEAGLDGCTANPWPFP